MFDLLTLNDLYELHRQVSAEYHAVHATMLDGLVPLISPTSPEWSVKSAKCNELAEIADAAYAEINRREQELISHQAELIFRIFDA